MVSARQPATRILAAVAGLALLTLTVACPAPYRGKIHEKDGKQYGTTSGWIWRSTWWNFYERGQSYADGGYLEEATQDFRWAIERREADQRHARTYGMHFLDDYFPHRELGIALLRSGNLEDAERELVASLSQEPSARAKYYLNEVRRGLLRRKGLGHGPGPDIALDIAESFATREPNLWISGRARSSQYVESLEVGGTKVLVELAESELPFRVQVPVDLGESRVRVLATDLLGNRTETFIHLTGDRDGPVVVVRDISEIASGQIELVGTVHDPSGLASLRFAGIESARQRSTAAQLKLRLPRPKDDRIPFSATDQLGNETAGTIVLEGAATAFRSGSGNRSAHRASWGLVASIDSDLVDPSSVQSGPRTSKAIGKGIPSRSHDAPGSHLAGYSVNEIRWKLGQKIEAALDRAPPMLRIDGLGDAQTVYLDRIIVTGNVSDDSEVQRVAVDGNSLEFTPGREVFFSTLVPLAEGPNEIRVSATDISGKSGDRVLHIERKRPAIEDPSVRLAVAPLPFRQNEGLGELSQPLQNFLLDALVDQRRYRVVDRETLDKALREQSLSLTDLVDDDNALDVGRATPADAILVGRAYRRAGSVEAWVRLVDTETSEALVIEDVYGEDAKNPDLKSLMAALAQKLALSMPILETPVTAVDGDQVTIDKGRGDKLRPGMKVALFRRGAPIENPLGGPPLGFTYMELGRGRLLDVADGRTRGAIASPIPASASAPVGGDLLTVR